MDSTNSNAALPRAKQVAVVPVNLIQPADVGQSISAFDDWLISISDGTISLERISTMAGALPVLG
ncbi:hypothetical protein, partial [Burkholderia diffusa]